jgi:hypothetical protein
MSVLDAGFAALKGVAVDAEGRDGLFTVKGSALLLAHG